MQVRITLTRDQIAALGNSMSWMLTEADDNVSVVKDRNDFVSVLIVNESIVRERQNEEGCSTH